ncbi:glycosyltransferase family 39 protein [Xanthocytophaga agilis]|uniref:Glycosyltransferase family 39 protein n=1 Tax=Xanthocytophaga agilis TaxID=3048010 RepID=A0AAE3R2M0_9BACT|nr:glycosyltransferase family 39 protein [Xanthocytophaga agilis]MDJ1499733.1 glycosyltransferase family 39 protein [Xanthocytophaga agilis]
MNLRSIKNLSPIILSYYSIIFIGCFLAIFQFLYNRSLWYDEAMLAVNIVSKDFNQLLKPLDKDQVAPIGFLFVEKINTLIFGNNEYALRLFPLLCFLASIPFYYLFTYKLTNDQKIALAATTFFSISFFLIKYSDEVKQYSTDVFFCVLIYHTTLHFQSDKAKSFIVYTLTGCIAVWFSNVSVIILFTCGLYIMHQEIYKKRQFRSMIPIVFWTASFATYYLLFIHNHPTQKLMVTFWKDAFLPLNPFSKNFYIFLFNTVKGIYSELISYFPLWPIPCILSTTGIWFLLKKKNCIILYLLLFPLFTHLLLSGLKLYPFFNRLVLYLVPLLILLYILSLCEVFEWINASYKKLPEWLLLVPIVIILGPLAVKFPFTKEEINKTLDYVKAHSKTNDHIYVYTGAIPGLEFYQKTRRDTLTNPLIYGTNHRDQNAAYDAELTKLKGKVWLIFSHIYEYAGPTHTEETYMIDFLLKHKAIIVDKKEFPGTSCYYMEIY